MNQLQENIADNTKSCSPEEKRKFGLRLDFVLIDVFESLKRQTFLDADSHATTFAWIDTCFVHFTRISHQTFRNKAYFIWAF